VSRRALVALTCVFLALRALLLFSSADRIGEPDAAETKLMELGDRWIVDGAPSPGELLVVARAGRNAPHGGFLPVSLTYAALAVPRGAAGSIGTLKAVTVLGAAVGFVAWTLAAVRLVGPVAGWLFALLLLLPPPALLGGQLVAWGSHAEVPWLLGLLAWAAARRDQESGWSEVLAVGLLAGATAAFDLLAAPLALALLAGWALDRGRSRLMPALLIAAIPVALSLWITGAGHASVTETAGNEPLALLGGIAAPALLLETVGRLLPLPFVGPAQLGEPGALLLNGGLTIGTGLAALGAVLSMRQRGRRIWWLVLGPVGFLILVAATAPRRPALAVRYLLPVWPLLLLAVAAGAHGCWTRWRSTRPVVALLVGALLLLGLATAVDLIAPSRIGLAGDWDPARYTANDLGHVTYELAPGIRVLLDQAGPRVVTPGPEAPDLRGLAAVLGAGSADCLLLDGSHRFAPELVAQRLEAVEGTLSTPENHQFYSQVGWGLAVVYPGQTASRLAILSRLEPDARSAAEQGEAEARGWLDAARE
jgi:hypothetical protein